MTPSLVIQALDFIDPACDPKWVPDGDDQWFLPCFLDLKNNTYSGYWYAKQYCVESEHYHTGISSGTVLKGKIVLKCNDEKLEVTENKNFFMNANILHSGEIIPNQNIFLCFGTIVGETNYHHEKLDTKTYYDAVISHYTKHNICFDKIINK